MHILLLTAFKEVSSEDVLGRRGVKSTRADFVVRDTATIVELKYVRAAADIARIQDEITSDAPHYGDRENVHEVAFLIYDPKDLCHDRDAFEEFVCKLDTTFVVYFL